MLFPVRIRGLSDQEAIDGNRLIDRELDLRIDNGGFRLRSVLAGRPYFISQPDRRSAPRGNSVRRDVRGLELLSASANPAADRYRLFHAIRRLTFLSVQLSLS